MGSEQSRAKRAKAKDAAGRAHRADLPSSAQKKEGAEEETITRLQSVEESETKDSVRGCVSNGQVSALLAFSSQPSSPLLATHIPSKVPPTDAQRNGPMPGLAPIHPNLPQNLTRELLVSHRQDAR